MKRRVMLKRGNLEVYVKIPVLQVLRIVMVYEAPGYLTVTELKIYKVKYCKGMTGIREVYSMELQAYNTELPESIDYSCVYDIDTHRRLGIEAGRSGMPSHYYLKTRIR